MTLTPIVAAILTAATLSAAAGQTPQAAPQPPPDCSAPEHHQFDFWIGEWTVTGPQEQAAGRNHIERAMKGCALIERWTSARGGQGTSINFYDRIAKAWFQSWIDDTGGALRMKGGLVDGRMVMQTDTLTRANGQTVIHRVTWSPEDGGKVRQLWETTTDDGKTWSATFDGIYSRTR
jgi:hypothetical protein